jgi:hypothetical protein
MLDLNCRQNKNSESSDSLFLFVFQELVTLIFVYKGLLEN